MLRFCEMVRTRSKSKQTRKIKIPKHLQKKGSRPNTPKKKKKNRCASANPLSKTGKRCTISGLRKSTNPKSGYSKPVSHAHLDKILNRYKNKLKAFCRSSGSNRLMKSSSLQAI